MQKLKITEKYAKEFDKKCAMAKSHDFLRFLSEPDYNNISLLDLIARVENTINIKPHKSDRNFKLNKTVISSYMNEFFSLYMPEKANEIKLILNRTHPFFLDKRGKPHINFICTKKGDKRSSSVGHHGRNDFLEFNVFIHNSIDDLRTTAHELSHAISSHHQYEIQNIRANKPLKNKNFSKDCMGEIESLLTEKLFNKYLVSKGIYTNEDLENYENQQQDGLLHDINLIREERDIIKELSCPVTFESLDKLAIKLQKQNKNRLIDRIMKMHDDKTKYSSYQFRYVVGRIVADQWIKEFDKKYETQSVMLEKFQAYLDKTHELNLDKACEELLNKNFECVVEDYILDKVNENKNLEEKFKK